MTLVPIGVGIVGLGFGARVHLPGFRMLEELGLRVEAVCGRCRRHAEEVGRREGVRVHDDWQALVGDPAVALVSIALPPGLQPDVAEAALRSGKAVLCEKPLALDAARASALADAGRGRAALVNFSYRALPAFRLAEQLISDGSLGSLERIGVSWHVRSLPPDGTQLSWKDSVAEGGGSLSMYGVHVFDYVAWLAGPPQRVGGTLRLANVIRVDEHGRRRRIASDAGFDASLDLPEGARADVSVSLAGAHEPVHRIEIAGRRRRLVLENRDGNDPVRPWHVTLDGRALDPGLPAWAAPAGVDPRAEPLAVHAAELAGAVRSGGVPSPSFDDGLRAQLLLEAIRAAASTGASEVVRTRQAPG